MSQSATLYRISKTDFENNRSEKQRMLSLAKGFATFDETFMGLDFILKKGQDKTTQAIIDAIFNPLDYVAYGTNPDFENFSDDELDELFFEDDLICYLEPDKVVVIDSILEQLTRLEIASRFNPEELNEKDIHPNVWHSNNSPDQAFNLNNLLEEFESLRNLFSQASNSGKYILQCIG